MGFFSDLFGLGRQREIDALLNPISAMKLREFAIVDDDPRNLKHYFRFTNRDGDSEEFIAVYQIYGADTVYARTHWRRAGHHSEFGTLNERGPWSMAISHLIREGERLAPQTRPTQGHLASRVPANLTQKSPPNPAPTPTPTRGEAKVPGQSMQTGGWHARRTTKTGEKVQQLEIGRSYQFSGLPGSDTQATLRVVLTLEGELVPQGLSLGRKLRFYLWPFRLPHDAEFTMTLKTVDGAAGSVFSVSAAPVDGDRDTAMIARYGGPNDVANCITAFMAGEPLIFNLSDETESLVNFVLPNDRAFKDLYDNTYQSLVSPPDDESLPVPSKDEVRRNPKSYGIWLIEPEPSEYRVLLVKLKDGGDSIEEGWYLGSTFDTRDEQGIFGLAAARDFQIKLSDVVKS